VESGEIYRRDNTAGDLSRKYSVNASDNSDSSFLHKVKNIFSKNRGADTPQYRKRIKGMMEEIADVKIRYGKMDKGWKSIYDSFGRVIRVKNAHDWREITPLFGRAVSEKLGIPQSEEMDNYIASWILTGEPNNTSAEAKDFQKAMRDNPDVAERLLDLQSAFQHWDNMNSMERMQNIIAWGNDEKTTLDDMINKWRDQFIEELGPIKRIVEAIEKKHGNMRAATNPYKAFRLFRGHYGRAMTMIEGSSKALEGLRHHFPNINWEGFKTIQMILDSIGGEDEKTRKEFETYCLACHVADIHKRNNEIWEEIEQLEAKKDTASEDEKDAYQSEIDRLEENIMETPSSEEDCAKVIDKYGDRFRDAQQDLVHYSNTMLAIMLDSGMISELKFDRLTARWPNYVPMFRVFDENGAVQFGDSMKSLTGSTRDVIEPLQSIIRNTYDMVRKAEKNKAKCLLANLCRLSDVGKYIDPVTHPAKDERNTIVYYVDGKKCYLETDPAVVAAVNNMGKESTDLFFRIFRVPAQIARASFTVMNPSFLIRNATRDMQDAFVYNKHGIVNPMDFVRGFLHAFRKDEVYWEWMASGAAQASAVSIDRNYTQSTIDKMTKTTRGRLKNPYRLFLDAMQRLAEFSEMGTRLASYERTKKTLAKGDEASLTALELAEAAYESRDLMDFARGGVAGRSWNQVAVFANASIQGWDKFFRTFNFRKDPKAAMRATARLMLSSMLPALLLSLAHAGDDWWKEIPDWQKDTHWILAPNIRIPKGQDIGLRFFSSFIEKGIDSSVNNNPLTFARVMKPVMDQLPSIKPTAMMPLFEAIANYNTFTEAPVVPKYQENLPAKLQYNGNTSSLAKFLGDKLDMSPRKIEHVFFGYTGNVGRTVTSLSDAALGTRRLNTSTEELPILNGFMMTPYKHAKTIDDFYEELQRQSEGDKAYKATKERMEGYDPAKYKRMNAANKKMSDLNKKERKLLDDNRISPEMKKELQAGLQRQRIDIAKRAMGK
jgi:hypothetical protein